MSAAPNHTGRATVTCCPRKAAAVRQDRQRASNCCTKSILPSFPDCCLFLLFLPGKQHVCWEKGRGKGIAGETNVPAPAARLRPSSCKWKESQGRYGQWDTGICLPCGTKESTAAWRAHRLPSLEQTQNETNKAHARCIRQGPGKMLLSGLGNCGQSCTQHRQLLLPASAHSDTTPPRQEPLSTAITPATGVSPKTW